MYIRTYILPCKYAHILPPFYYNIENFPQKSLAIKENVHLHTTFPSKCLQKKIGQGLNLKKKQS